MEDFYLREYTQQSKMYFVLHFLWFIQQETVLEE